MIMRAADSIYFYDLETSGFNPGEARIMQFAGQRTDLDLNPIGSPANVLIKMTDDVLPDPDAVLITGLTPQRTIADGVTEAEFLRRFTQEIAMPGTVFAGFNTVRFDDEFMRGLHYRNFYDPYEWQWRDGRSKWDLMDVVRMTRALRPDGIIWPSDGSGKASNRLELLASANGLDHEHAHDALSDVMATIAVARLVKEKQRKLFDYLFGLRDKRTVADTVGRGGAFVYTSGRYPSEQLKTTVAAVICDQPKRQAVFVFDLRYDPSEYAAMTAEQLAEAWRYKKDRTQPCLPVKQLTFNRCPAVAPLGVLDDASRDRLGLDMAAVERHLTALKSLTDFSSKLCKAWDMREEPEQVSLISTESDVDDSMYDGFFTDADKGLMRAVREADPAELGVTVKPHFTDKRLESLLPLYKARNYHDRLTPAESASWERYRAHKLLDGGDKSRMARFLSSLQAAAARPNLTGEQEYLLEELRLYAENIMPETD